MLHKLAVRSFSDTLLEIDFYSSYHSSGYERERERDNYIALRTLLIYSKLKEGDDKNPQDFNFRYRDGYQSLGAISLNVHGKANIIVVLDIVTENKNLFVFSTSHIDQGSFYRRYASLLANAIDDKSMSISDREKISGVTKRFLDTSYQLLMKEELVINLKKKAELNDGDNFLKHPFYQTLSLLLEDYIERKALHDNKGMFDRVFNSKSPSNTTYNAVFEKFLVSVPGCYKSPYDVQGKRVELIDTDKIKQSRSGLPQQPTNSATSNVVNPPSPN